MDYFISFFQHYLTRLLKVKCLKIKELKKKSGNILYVEYINVVFMCEKSVKNIKKVTKKY